jgi:integrase
MANKAKRAAHGAGMIRKRDDDRWEARVTLGRDPGTGKQKTKSFYGKTQAEVRKKLQQATVDIDNGVYVEPSKMTLAAWLDVWIKDYNKEVKPRTLALYAGQVNHRIKPGLGALRLSEIRKHDIQAFINQQGQIIPGKNGEPDKPALSAKSVINLHGILHKALEQAVDLGYIKVNPADKSVLPRWEKPPIKPIDGEQMTAFLQAVKGHEHETLFKVGIFSGMRQGELLGLTWDCVNFSTGTIHVRRQLQLIKGEYLFTMLKNDKTRYITPASAIMQLLQDHQRKQAAQKKQAGSVWDNPDNHVFTDAQGRHLARQTIYQYFKRIVKEIGIEDTRFHDMRHSYGVASLRAGDDIKTLQENMGHHSAAFTLDQYGHVTPSMRQESAARMDKYIQSIAVGDS